MKAARQLAALLRNPAQTDIEDWNAVIAAARAESLIGSLAWRLEGRELPKPVERVMQGARREAEHVRVRAWWAAEMARRALAPLGIPVVLLKGTAYAAADLSAGQGRSIGDLDILVPRNSLEAAQQALLAAGWEWVKPDPYDDQYYRQWMHELPPLIHRERDRMIDVHHTILPLTARRRPDAAAMIEASEKLDDGLRILAPADMVIHSAAHLFADGDLAGGLRNLWDIHCLLSDFAPRDPDFWPVLEQRAEHHELSSAVHRAARLADDLYGTAIPENWRVWDSADPLFKARLLARNGWGRPTRPGLRFGFYIRSHWMRMPPMMLARHLLTKALRQSDRRAPSSSE
jgi:hypothetical protein